MAARHCSAVRGALVVPHRAIDALLCCSVWASLSKPGVRCDTDTFFYTCKGVCMHSYHTTSSSVLVRGSAIEWRGHLQQADRRSWNTQGLIQACGVLPNDTEANTGSNKYNDPHMTTTTTTTATSTLLSHFRFRHRGSATALSTRGTASSHQSASSSTRERCTAP